jgi:hypothetical protein
VFRRLTFEEQLRLSKDGLDVLFLQSHVFQVAKSVPFEAFPERVSAFPLRFIENNNRFTFTFIIISSSSSLEHERGQIDGRYLVHHPKNDTPPRVLLLS